MLHNDIKHLIVQNLKVNTDFVAVNRILILQFFIDKSIQVGLMKPVVKISILY